MAYAALPLVLHDLDVKLSTTESQTARKQRRLNIYTEAMKVLQLQYDGTDEVSDILGTILNYIIVDTPTQSCRFNMSGESPEKQENQFGGKSTSVVPIKYLKAINDWGDVFLRRTSLYLRLCITLDLFLSKGRLPDNTDFPSALQSPSPSPLYHISIHDTLESNTKGWDVSYPDLSSNNACIDKYSNTNRFPGSAMSTNEGLAGQVGFRLSCPVVESVSQSTYFETFDMEIPDNNSSFLTDPATWADGMFLDDV